MFRILNFSLTPLQEIVFAISSGREFVQSLYLGGLVLLYNELDM